MKLILDSNVFDDLLAGKISINNFNLNENEIFITHIQVDEINECPDKFKRASLFNLLIEIRPEKIPTETFALGFSRIGNAKLGDAILFQKLRNSNLNHSKDALIGETAIKQNLILITNDKRLRNKVIELGGSSMNIEEFKIQQKENHKTNRG
jgi:predicted nucleic acid-binding protein